MKKGTTFPSTLTIPRIYQTFRKYIEGNNYFRIFFFPGKGYLWVTAEEYSGTITTEKQMISKLMDNIIDDVVFSPSNRGHVEGQLSQKKGRFASFSATFYWKPMKKNPPFIFNA